MGTAAALAHDPVIRLSGHTIEINAKTRWIFVQLETAAGLTGVGEASLNGQEKAVLEAAERLARPVFAQPNAQPHALASPDHLAAAAAVSAIDQALWDILGKRQGCAVAELLGGAGKRDRVPLYANVNRRTRDRSPVGFVASARAALGAGFTAIKIAPFDEVTPGIAPTARLLEPGLERIAAIREAVGDAVDLMVDCHWRLDEAAAREVIRAVEPLRLYWIECPLPEIEDNLPALRRLRDEANARGIRLAGLEHGIGIAAFAPYLSAGVYDVMMPDAKYVGGLAQMVQLAERFAEEGVAFSPHNPTGPVCHAASLQVCAAVGKLDRLEIQFDETELFHGLVEGLPLPRDGVWPLPAEPSGFGVSLVPEMLGRFETMRLECRAGAKLASRSGRGWKPDECQKI